MAVAVSRRWAHRRQVDGPQDLYERPANLFVGGFIGSPAMNIVEGTLETENGGFFAVFGGNRLRIDDGVLAERPVLPASASASLRHRVV